MQRGLRLRAGRDGQLGVLRQPDAGQRPRSSSTTSRAGKPVVPDARRRQRRARSRRCPACSPASTTGGPTRASAPACRRCAASSWRGPRAGPRRTFPGATALRRCGDHAPKVGGEQSSAERPATTPGDVSPAARAEEADHRRREGVVMATTLTPVLTDTWDADRSWSLATYEAGRRLPRPASRPGHAGGRRRHHGQGLRPARPRRRGLPDGHEVGLPARARRRTALPRRQRGRVRAGDLQGHPAHDGQPAAPDRGHDHHELRDRLPPRVPLRARRGPARLPPPAARDRGGPRGRLPRHGHPRLRLRPRDHAARRCRRVHLRRGDGAARLARGPARPAAAQAPVPRGRRPVRAADRGEQRRVDRVGAGHRRRAARTGSSRWAPSAPPGHGLFSLSGHVTRPGPVRGAARHHAARAARDGRRHPRGPRAEVLDARRARRRRSSRPSTSTSRSTTSRSARRARCSARARCRSSTRPPRWSAR